MRKKTQKSKVKTQKSGGFLAQILEKRREDLKISSLQYPPRPLATPPMEGKDLLINAIRQASGIVVIGELKFASPSGGVLCSPRDLDRLVRAYEKAGVNAISVITEQHFFHGKPQFVRRVKALTPLPVLQKDFVIDMRQIVEAQQIGSDALLLIARIVSTKELVQLVTYCFSVGIEPVVEISSSKDLKKALATRTRIIAVNARDLETFSVDVKKACRLLQEIPVGYVKLGFSGILGPKEVALYKKAGAQGILIGTALIKAPPSSRLRRAREVNVDAFLSSLRKQTR